MADLWNELDEAVLSCLSTGHTAPDEIGKCLGMSEAAASSILAMLLAQGKVRIRRVSLVESDDGCGVAL